VRCRPCGRRARSRRHCPLRCRSGSACRVLLRAQRQPRPNQRLLARSAIALSSDCINQQHHHAPAPPDRPQGLQPAQRMACDRAQPEQRPGHPAALPHQHRAQQGHEVGPLAIVDQLDVGVAVDVMLQLMATSFQALRSSAKRTASIDSLFGAHQFAQAVAEPRQASRAACSRRAGGWCPACRPRRRHRVPSSACAVLKIHARGVRSSRGSRRCRRTHPAGRPSVTSCSGRTTARASRQTTGSS